MYNKLSDNVDFTTEFSTYILAYCPDTDSWFATNQRFFYYEYDKEFETEQEAINYFENHIKEFADISVPIIKEMWKNMDFPYLYLENNKKSYIIGEELIK